jgi:nascent polypeptide-associated complex subunit alpha
MFPNIDPRKLKSMMDQMGIKTTEIEATKVVIYMQEKEIVITDPQVMKTEMQGQTQYQISGSVEEKPRELGGEDKMEITEDDVHLVQEKTGKPEEEVRKALQNSKGDIAKAIIDLGGPD